MFQKVHQIAAKYTAILTVGESALSPSLFCFNPKRSRTTIIKDTASLRPSQPPSSRMDTTSSSGQRRQWHPTPVLLPGKSHEWRSLVGCSPWGCLESDTTERLSSSSSSSSSRSLHRMPPCLPPHPDEY